MTGPGGGAATPPPEDVGPVRGGVRPLHLLVANWQDLENPRAGGAEIHLHRVFGGLAARGHRVTLVTSAWSGAPARAELDGMRIFRTGGRHAYLLAAPPLLRRLLREDPPDLLVEDLNKVPLFTPLWTRSPLVLLVHHLFGGVAFQEASPPVALATWLLERPVGKVYRGVPTVAVSQSTADDLAARGLDPRQIRVIPNGVDAERLVPSPEGREEVPTVLYLGRLKRYKRVDLVLRAVALLRARGRTLRLVVGGKGDHGEALARLARQLELTECVEFRGFVPEEEKRTLLQRSWVHVLTSPREGWGISILEAAACGTPTVASDSPGLRDSVRHEETGLLVPHGDVPALADALERLLLDRPFLERLGKGARRWAEVHGWEGVVDRWEGFLEGVVDRSGGSPGHSRSGAATLPPGSGPL